MIMQLHELNQVACIVWVAFLHCKVASVFSNGLADGLRSDIGCTCLTFLRYAFSNVFSKHFDQNMHNYTGCTCTTCLHWTFSNVSWKCLNWSMHNELMMPASIVFFFSMVQFQMSPQIVFPRGYTAVLGALVLSFPNECIQVCLKLHAGANV